MRSGTGIPALDASLHPGRNVPRLGSVPKDFIKAKNEEIEDKFS
jgi:hypothetical protein